MVSITGMYPRFVENRVRETLSVARVVFISGPRQSGKTTLAQKFTSDNMPYFSLDDVATRKAALSDPVGFIRVLDRAVIDEVHRVPELILAIKLSVDADTRSGRFLLTGSADFLKLPGLEDSLAGRMSIVRLLPLSQSELKNSHSSFLSDVFAQKVPESTNNLMIDHELIEAVLAGGYPEALTLPIGHLRQNWHLDYVDAIIRRDFNDIARIDQLDAMPRLIRILARHSGQLANYSRVGKKADMNHVTTRRYVSIFEYVYLVHSLQPWFTNRLKRIVKSPKLHFLDSGLLVALMGVSQEHLNHDRTLFEPIFESFVLGELLKLASWSEERYFFWHFRQNDKQEVDIVIEDLRGNIVGVEVKASASVNRKDFAGLRSLAHACGDKFALGVVLYNHDKTLPFGDRLVAAPVSALWS